MVGLGIRAFFNHIPEISDSQHTDALSSEKVRFHHYLDTLVANVRQKKSLLGEIARLSAVQPETDDLSIGAAGIAEGREVKLAEYLERVWEVVGRTALENVLGSAEAKARNGTAGALKEDARLTALFLWTLQSTNGQGNHRGETEGAEDGPDGEGETDETSDENSAVSAPQRSSGFSLVFDVVRRFAQPLGVDLAKWEGRIVQTSKGVVRLLPVGERAKQLFGEEGASAAAGWLEEDGERNLQQVFPGMHSGRIGPLAVDSHWMRRYIDAVCGTTRGNVMFPRRALGRVIFAGKRRRPWQCRCLHSQESRTTTRVSSFTKK